MPLIEISAVSKACVFLGLTCLISTFFSALNCDQIWISLCCIACHQGPFWSFFLLIPTDISCILSSKISIHFCLLAHVCQHIFLLIHSTLNYCTIHIPPKSPFSQCISCRRWFKKAFDSVMLLSGWAHSTFHQSALNDYLIQSPF